MDRKTVFYIQGVARYGGAPESLYRLASRLKGYKPLVVTSREGELTKRLAHAGVEFFTVKMDMWRKARTWPCLPYTIYQVYKGAKKGGTDIVHCNTLWDTPYGVILARLLKVPVVTHIRNTLEHEKIKKYWLNKVDLIIAVSKAVAQPLRDAGLPHKVIYNGVDLMAFDRERVSGRQVRWEFGLGEALLVLLPGRVDSTKGHKEAILAMAKVVREVPRTVLAIVGETSRQEAGLMNDLKNLAQKAGIGERVIFTGARSDMPAMYAAADLVIMPSLDSAREGFGRVLIEGMAMGKATVATRTGGIPEVVEDGETGLLVPTEDVEALARAIVELLRNEKRRREMGEKGYERVKELFDLEKTVAQVEGVYGELLNA